MLVLPVAPVVFALRVELEVAGGPDILAEFLYPEGCPVGGVETVVAALDKPPSATFHGWLEGDLCRRSESFSVRTHEDAIFDFTLAPQGIGDDSERTIRNPDERDFVNRFLFAFCDGVESVVNGFDGDLFDPVVLHASRGANHGIGGEHCRQVAACNEPFLAVATRHPAMEPDDGAQVFFACRVPNANGTPLCV